MSDSQLLKVVSSPWINLILALKNTASIIAVFLYNDTQLKALIG
jgi:hypothetical protein